MTNQQDGGIRDADELSGRDLQQSQATGAAGGGDFTRSQMQQDTGGEQMGGGPSQSDMAAPGGSSGSGGYGQAQNQASHQGQQQAQQSSQGRGQSRGEAYDEQQGGGRDFGSVRQQGGSDPAEDRQLDQQADALIRDQQEHQDRGQSSVEDGQQG